ncbi:hypothetical protein ACFL52_01600 [Candidatus Margulisiibacteriota bacterium]
MAKTLGKLEAKLLQKIQAKGRIIFCLKDALPITRTSYDATRLLIGNLIKKGWLIRLKKGTYLTLSLLDEASILKARYQAAAALTAPYPYYFSHYCALSLQSMTTQPVKTIYISTPKRIAGAGKTILNVPLRFIYCPAKKIWGTEEKWIDKQNKITVSSPEKTILDCLSRPDLCGGISEIAKAIWIKRMELNYKKLVLYAKRTNIDAVSKRLGFIIELFELGNRKIIAELNGKSKSVPLFDPTLAKKGFYSKLWHLFINSDPEELKQIIRT